MTNPLYSETRNNLTQGTTMENLTNENPPTQTKTDEAVTEQQTEQINSITIDVETFCKMIIKDCGLYRYVWDPTFEILLFAYSINNHPVQIIDIANGEKIPDEVIAALLDEKVEKWAFNATFERICLSKFLGLPNGKYLDPKSWKCVQVWGATVGLPFKLEQVSEIMKLDKQKISEGKKIITYFCQPCKPIKANGGRSRNLPHHNPEMWKKFKEYNIRDVDALLEIQKRLSRFPVVEQIWKEYEIDQRINDKGVAVDMNFVQNAIKIHEISHNELFEKMKKLTGLENPNSRDQLIDWLAKNDIKTKSIDKDTVASLIINAPQKIKEVLLLRQQLSKNSIKKYFKIKDSICSDGRIRGMLRFYRANRTGRWAGEIVQLQNLPKNSINDIEKARELIINGDFETFKTQFENVQEALSGLIRTALIPEKGSRFIVLDFSSIEARVLSWLAKETWKITAFAENKDIYCESASKMFNCPVEKEGVNSHLRQKGKIAELALGYGGRNGALIAMGALDMGLCEEELPEIIESWRQANSNIVNLWWKIGDKAVESVKYKCKTETHNIKLFYDRGILFIKLPSGRKLAYPFCKTKLNQYGKEQIVFKGMNSTENKNKWEDIDTYGSKLVENIVQGIARDILAHAMKNLQDYNIIMHVHDEIIIECDENESLQEISEKMCQTPSWAEGLLLKAEGFVTDFYKKG